MPSSIPSLDNRARPGRKTESTDIIIVARRVRSIELRGCTDQSRPVFGNIQGNLDQGGRDHEHLKHRRAAQGRGNLDPSRAPGLVARRRNARRASSCAASLALLPTTAQAQQHGAGSQHAAPVLAGRSSAPGTAISAFCAHFPVTTVSSIVGANETLLRPSSRTPRTSAYSSHHRERVGGHHLDETEHPGRRARHTGKAAEASVAARVGKGAKLIFTALPPSARQRSAGLTRTR